MKPITPTGLANSSYIYLLPCEQRVNLPVTLKTVLPLWNKNITLPAPETALMLNLLSNFKTKPTSDSNPHAGNHFQTVCEDRHSSVPAAIVLEFSFRVYVLSDSHLRLTWDVSVLWYHVFFVFHIYHLFLLLSLLSIRIRVGEDTLKL